MIKKLKLFNIVSVSFVFKSVLSCSIFRLNIYAQVGSHLLLKTSVFLSLFLHLDYRKGILAKAVGLDCL